MAPQGAKLNKIFEVRSNKRAAAGIAGLVGSTPASEVLAEATKRFRSIPLDQLDCDDVTDNEPDPGLFSKSLPTQLHRCDAFVSHSWRDSAPEKWAALQHWRGEFMSIRGREPRVWFDKCCVDQTNIQADLRCLPVFLSGCRRMVVLCGVTYLTRLWCVIELFTFVHIGRKVEELKFEPVLREGQEQEDLMQVANSFLNFDAEQCTCFLKEDKDRMLSIIRTAFGDIQNFNSEVQGIFRQMGWQMKLQSRHLDGLCSEPSPEPEKVGPLTPLSSDSDESSPHSDSDDSGSSGMCRLTRTPCGRRSPLQASSYPLDNYPSDGTSGSDDLNGNSRLE